MDSQIINSENNDRDLVRAYFDQAFFNTALDDKGSLFVKDKFKVYIDIGKKKTNITFSVYFNVREDSGPQDRLDLSNMINKELIQLKAILGDNNILTLEYDLWVEGGVCAKNLILAFRSFVSQVTAALGKDKQRIFL